MLNTVKGPFLFVPWLVTLYPFETKFDSNCSAVTLVCTFWYWLPGLVIDVLYVEDGPCCTLFVASYTLTEIKKSAPSSFCNCSAS
ncbi:hypothetical protein P3T23_009575 [Paraburkholderia sp. GAS448]